MLKAIKKRLENGSIKTVIVRGSGEQYPSFKGRPGVENPYVVVYYGESLIKTDNIPNTMTELYIEAHFPIGHIDRLNNYIYEEVLVLLKAPIDYEGKRFKLEITERISPLIEENDNRALTGGNDDKTLSKTRVFMSPIRWK